MLSTQINIYMTHMTNYGSDRLALYTFDKVVTFVQTWTNIKLRAEKPVKLAQKYFEFSPQEKEPLWTVSNLQNLLDKTIQDGGCIVNLVVIRSYTTVTGLELASDWHPRTKMLTK